MDRLFIFISKFSLIFFPLFSFSCSKILIIDFHLASTFFISSFIEARDEISGKIRNKKYKEKKDEIELLSKPEKYKKQNYWN